MKNNKLVLTLSIACMLSLVSCGPIQSFDEYCDDILVAYLGGDQLAINLFFKDQESFGFEHGDATWYTYSTTEDGEMEAIIAENKRLLDKLHKYDFEELTELQQVTYKQIEEMFEHNIEVYSIPNYEYMNLYYIDQFGGYVANFASYMETYKLRTEQDVKDIITCVQSTEDAFKSYLDFASDKVEKGYPYSDFTISSMQGYLDDLLEQGDEYYLYEFLNNKIGDCAFLDEAKITDYQNQVKDALKNDFFVGVDALNKGLDQYIGKCNANLAGYWAGYGEVGKQLFTIELKDTLGMKNLDMNQYIATLDHELNRTMDQYLALYEGLAIKHNITSSAALDSFMEYYPICGGDLDTKMDYLKEFSKTIVPDLETTPEITIKEMDLAAAEVSNAVAYYTKSALDEFDHEYITLNPLNLDIDNDVLGTLAHEGYPGHLYEYVFSKELDIHPFSKLNSNLAHAEGWATYVEYALYNYAYKNFKVSNPMTTLKGKDVIKYLQAEHEMGFLLECRIDVGIHYEGWTVSKVASYLNGLGYNGEAAQEIYDLLVEMPATYAAYGYGKYFFINIHKEAKNALGSNYDEVDYNKALMSKGWVGLDMLQEIHNEYIASKTQG